MAWQGAVRGTAWSLLKHIWPSRAKVDVLWDGSGKQGRAQSCAGAQELASVGLAFQKLQEHNARGEPINSLQAVCWQSISREDLFAASSNMPPNHSVRDCLQLHGMSAAWLWCLPESVDAWLQLPRQSNITATVSTVTLLTPEVSVKTTIKGMLLTFSGSTCAPRALPHIAARSDPTAFPCAPSMSRQGSATAATAAETDCPTAVTADPVVA
jgi:hypothetical protein